MIERRSGDGRATFEARLHATSSRIGSEKVWNCEPPHCRASTASQAAIASCGSDGSGPSTRRFAQYRGPEQHSEQKARVTVRSAFTRSSVPSRRAAQARPGDWVARAATLRRA